MNRKKSYLAIIFFTALCTGSIAAQTNNHIQLYTENPRYWQYQDNPVLLIGGSDDDNLFQWTGSTLADHLDQLVAVGGNYVRNTMSDRDEQGDAYAFRQLPSGLYDLNQWNDEYFNRLANFLQQTASRDILVQIEIWDEWDFQTSAYERSPWNPQNNISYRLAETIMPATHNPNRDVADHQFFKTIPQLHDDKIVLGYQQAFIEKVLSITFQFDHVLYTIMNESRADRVWSYYWADYLRTLAADAGHAIYIAPMRGDPGDTVEEVLQHPDRFDFADISQSAKWANQAHADVIIEQWNRLSEMPRPLNSTKQYGAYIKRSWVPEFEDEGLSRLWRAIFCGQASVRHHRPEAGLGLDSIAQNNIKALRTITEMLVPWQCQPHQQAVNLLKDRQEDEVYIMADPGRVYGLYFPGEGFTVNDERVPGDGVISLDISHIKGEVRVRWFDIEAHRWLEPEHVQSNGTIPLNTPDNGHWLALVSLR